VQIQVGGDFRVANLTSSRMFWDSKARENPYWYISSFLSYSEPNLRSFWESGYTIWNEVKTQIGYEPGPEATVVEIGCGIGRLTRAIAPEVGTVHAFDISAEMLRQGLLGAPENSQFHLSRGDSLRPVQDGVADLVLAYLVYQHLPDEQVLSRYLREMVRVARPGGLIAFTTAPRDWRALCLALLRLRAKLWSGAGGPRQLHCKEWSGIRPSPRRVQALCPIALKHTAMASERWLFWGRVPTLPPRVNAVAA